MPARVDHHAYDGLAVPLGSEGYGVRGYPEVEVGGAVKRIENPAHCGGARVGGALLAEDRIVRTVSAQHRDHMVLRGPIGLGDEVCGGRLGVEFAQVAGRVLLEQTCGTAGRAESYLFEFLREGLGRGPMHAVSILHAKGVYVTPSDTDPRGARFSQPVGAQL